MYLQVHMPRNHQQNQNSSFSAPRKAATLEKKKKFIRSVKIEKQKSKFAWWETELMAYLRALTGRWPPNIGWPSWHAWYIPSTIVSLLPHFVKNVSKTISWCRVVLIPLTKFWNSSTFLRLKHQKPQSGTSFNGTVYCPLGEGKIISL